MRYINIEELELKDEIEAFNRLAQTYLQQMQTMTPEERKKFIKENTDWNMLQEIMYNLSFGKCWYSEAPPGAGDYEIDHFRPKNRSKQHDGTILKPNGYWWLSYSWRNYRLAGGLINKRRKDRLGSDEEVKGKGDYFPLDIEGGSIIAESDVNLNHELPILLDPTKVYDTSLISFDKSGEPIISATLSDDDKFRVEKSIFFYHLDLEQLNQYRAIIWNKCEDELISINEAVTNAPNTHTKRAILNRACNSLIDLTNKSAPFSKVALACIDSFLEKDSFKNWLIHLRRTLN
jgi:hypothetical protein